MRRLGPARPESRAGRTCTRAGVCFTHCIVIRLLIPGRPRTSGRFEISAPPSSWRSDWLSLIYPRRSQARPTETGAARARTPAWRLSRRQARSIAVAAGDVLSLTLLSELRMFHQNISWGIGAGGHSIRVSLQKISHDHPTTPGSAGVDRREAAGGARRQRAELSARGEGQGSRRAVTSTALQHPQGRSPRRPAAGRGRRHFPDRRDLVAELRRYERPIVRARGRLDVSTSSRSPRAHGSRDRRASPARSCGRSPQIHGARRWPRPP